MMLGGGAGAGAGAGAGPDKIQGFLSKFFTVVHEVLATVLNECIEVGDVLR